MKKLFHLFALLLLSTLNPMPRQSKMAAGQLSNKVKSMKTKLAMITALLAFNMGIVSAAPLGTAFTYQGRLTDGANPATGNYDLRFTVYDALTNGTLKAVVTNASVAVTNGLFTTPVDFGQAPNNFNAMWLEIGVRTNGSVGDFTTVTPRQALTPAPYAFYALNASNAVTAGSASNLFGVLPGAQLAGTYSSALSFNNVNNNFAGAFTGNGAGLTNVNAARLGGQGAGNFWQTGGNAGTVAGVNFIGTTDNQPLELWVNGQRAWRLVPTTDTPNVIGGCSNNIIAANIVGATIGGGGTVLGTQPNIITNGGQYGTIAGGYNNTVANYGGAVLGGSGNFAGGSFAAIGAGQFHTNFGDYSFLGGGYENVIWLATDYSFLGGGYSNSIQPYAYASFLGGGSRNSIQENRDSVLGGGYGNSIQPTADASVLGGGENNSIQANNSVLGGGEVNSIQSYADHSVLDGGYGNFIQLDAAFSVLGGGEDNSIQSYADHSVLGGGNNNAIGPNTIGCFLGGGGANTLQEYTDGSFLGGGGGNSIQVNADHSVLGGGGGNSIQTNAYWSFLGGGDGNTIGMNAHDSVLSGGSNNTNGAPYSVVPGGDQNSAAGTGSLASGHRAKANHKGAFVWADSQDVDFASTSSNQFLVRAAGGVGINTNNPGGAALNVNGAVVATNFVGSGAGLTGISAASLTSGIVGAALNLTNTANTFAGNGAGMTNLNATNLTAGTVADARLSTNVALLNASQTFSGVNRFTNTANIFAGNGVGLTNLNATNLTAGTVADARLSTNVALLNASQTFSGVNQFTNTANTFAGNGAGITNLNATNLTAGTVADARLAGNVARTNQVWLLNGNSGTTAGVNYLGTTDNQPLELRVNGLRALRLEPNTNGAPNVIGGSSANFIASGTIGAVIAGGGATIYFGSSYTNSIGAGADLSAIGGGAFNSILTAHPDTTLAGGTFNTVGGSSRNAWTYFSANTGNTISGGGGNCILDGPSAAAIGGGQNNTVSTNGYYTTIGGGSGNTVNSKYAVVGGGYANLADGLSGTVGGGATNDVSGDYGTIGGGANNTIQQGSPYCVIGGGVSNLVQESVFYCTIGGGLNNTMEIDAFVSTIAGGGGNDMQDAAFAAIGGGQNNTNGGNYATVPGGNQNYAAGDNSFAAGHRAKANNQGAFVWADSTDANFASTAANQFLIRASGGVGINKNNPATALDVNGTVTATTFVGGRLGIGNSAPTFQIDVTAPQAVARFITTNNINGSVLVLDNTTPGLTYHGAVNFNDGVGQIGYLSTDAMIFTTSNGERMRILSNGNVGIGTNNPNQKLVVAGNIYATGTITPNSDRNLKTDFAPVDAAAVLAKVAALPIQQWRFKAENASVKHVGPMAQDFRAAFGLGEIPTAIATVDADGVALAAIQGLNQKLNEKDAEIQALKQRLEALEQRLIK